MPGLASTSFSRPCRENPVRLYMTSRWTDAIRYIPPSLPKKSERGNNRTVYFPPSVHRRIRGDMPPNPTLWLMIKDTQRRERASICILPLLLNPHVFVGSLYRRLLRGRADRDTLSEYE